MQVQTTNRGITETTNRLLAEPHHKVDRILLSLTHSAPDSEFPEIETLSEHELLELVKTSTTSPPLSKAFVRLAEHLIKEERLSDLVAALSPEGSVHVFVLTRNHFGVCVSRIISSNETSSRIRRPSCCSSFR